MNWPDGTPLGDVIKRIRIGTFGRITSFPKGVPIYFDPDALRAAGKSMDSPVPALPPPNKYPDDEAITGQTVTFPPVATNRP